MKKIHYCGDGFRGYFITQTRRFPEIYWDRNLSKRYAGEFKTRIIKKKIRFCSFCGHESKP